jgi:uncharacterized membrane protein YgdD (TMEM256/DUF423 family)
MAKPFVMLAALLMMIGVAAGAFGSHGLSGYFERHPELESTYDTAVRYHLLHALGLLGVAAAAAAWPNGWANWAGYLIVAGIFVFSGSLYLLVFTGNTWLGAITPIGGVLFIAGWVALFIAALRA